MDSSYSMGGRPGFEDDKDSDAEDKAKELASNTVCTVRVVFALEGMMVRVSHGETWAYRKPLFTGILGALEHQYDEQTVLIFSQSGAHFRERGL